YPEPGAAELFPDPRTWRSLLAVTRRATRQAADAVFLLELGPERALIVGLVRIGIDSLLGWLPIHAEDLAARAKVVFRRAMAFQAPFHEQRVFLVEKRHLVHPAVA